jgi:hypothetical protein
VTSFFVSRVDTEIDRALEATGTTGPLSLRGKIAIANAKMVWRRFAEIFYGAPFAALKQCGARVQRPLWASTGVKNLSYRDVLYLEELIGLDTVNTVPPAMLNAFRHHGHVSGATLTEGMNEVAAALSRLPELGIDLRGIAEKLQADGILALASAYDRVSASLERKKQSILAGQPFKASSCPNLRHRRLGVSPVEDLGGPLYVNASCVRHERISVAAIASEHLRIDPVSPHLQHRSLRGRTSPSDT